MDDTGRGTRYVVRPEPRKVDTRLTYVKGITRRLGYRNILYIYDYGWFKSISHRYLKLLVMSENIC